MGLTTRSKAWVCRCSPAWIANSNPAGGMDVCCVLSGRDLCVGLITRPELVLPSVCVWVWSWSLIMRRPWPTRGCCAVEGEGISCTSSLYELNAITYEVIRRFIVYQSYFHKKFVYMFSLYYYHNVNVFYVCCFWDAALLCAAAY